MNCVDEKNTKSELSNARVEWIDILKGILITLVVVGHSTGIFNSWIYQFHMAGFFFISGYLSSIEKKSSLSLALSKVITLFLPFFSFSILCIFLNAYLDSRGLYEFLFGSHFVGTKNAILQLLHHGNLHVQYLGTFWFLTTLLGIELFHIFLYQILGKRINIIYFVICLVVYLFGYGMILNANRASFWIFSLDLVFIGQIYFNTGLLLKKINAVQFFNGKKLGFLLVFTVSILISFWGTRKGIAVDYPSRNFINPFDEYFVALASIFIVCFISVFTAKYLKYIKNSIMLLGRYSLGIMIFHFIFFKLYMVGMYFLDITTPEKIINVVLPDELKVVKYWLPMALVSIIGSVVIWHILRKVPVIKFLIGQDFKCNKFICKHIIEVKILKYVRFTVSKQIERFWMILGNTVRTHKLLSCGIFTVIALFSIPMYRIGIICNDELQARALALQGFAEFYKQYFNNHLIQGRILAAPIDSFIAWLSFIGVGSGTAFRIGSILILLGVIFSFGYLINKIFKSFGFACFTSFFALACMPICFEHMPPNAFVGHLAFSFMLILVSNSIYISYLETNLTKKAVISMSLFVLSMMSYEAFSTYVCLYLFITLGKTGISNIRNNFKFYLIPIATVILFVAVYLMARKIFPSSYEGNQIGFDSIFGPIKIISNLLLVSIPGFFSFFSRYNYLEQIYYNLTIFDYLRIVLFTFSFAFVVFVFAKKMLNDNLVCTKKSVVLHNIFIVLCGISFMILPSIPNSISVMYQNNVGFRSAFLALPITFMEYFASAFVICYLLWIFIKYVGGRFYVIVIALMSILVVNIQEMNDVISKEQNKNFNRLVSIEDFLKTDVAKGLAGNYYAKDFYKQQNLLAIHEGYWSNYSNKVQKINVQLHGHHVDHEIGSIYYDGDNFVIIDLQNIYVLSKDEELQSKSIPLSDTDYSIFDFKSPKVSVFKDHGFYVYKKNNDLSGRSRVGYIPKRGLFADKWMESESEFFVRTGENGQLKASLYYPGKSFEGKNIDVYFNDTLIKTVEITSEQIELDVKLGKNKSGYVRIKCNFEYEDKDSNDVRPLAIILSAFTIN